MPDQPALQWRYPPWTLAFILTGLVMLITHMVLLVVGPRHDIWWLGNLGTLLPLIAGLYLCWLDRQRRRAWKARQTPP